MKKIKINLVVAVIILLFSFTACNKDYADKYAGDWDFVTTKTIRRYHGSELELIKDTTICHLGKIIHGDGDRLIIQCTEEDKIPVYVTKKGEIWQSYPTFYSTCHACSLGNFENKNKMSLSCYRFIEDGNIIDYHVDGVRSKGGEK